jgi:hypothetical protein
MKMKALWNKNYKAQKKLVKDDTREWKDFPSSVHGSVELILWKQLYYLKQSTDLKQSASKFQWHSSQKEKKKFLKQSHGST